MNIFNWKKKPENNETKATEVKKKSYTLQDAGQWLDILGGTSSSAKDWKTTWVNTGVTVRAENFAKGEIYLYKKTGKSVQEVDQHLFLDIISNPNIWQQSFYELKYLLALSLDIFGEAYLFVLKNVKGQPHSFLLLNPALTKPLINSAGTEIIGFEYNGNSRIKYSTEDIIYFKLPSLNNPFRGQATIESCKHIINTDNYRQQLQEKFMLTGGNINVVLEADGEISPEGVEILNELMRSRQNIENTDAYLLLQEGIKYKDLKTSAKELDFVKSSDSIRNEIFAKLRVPLVLVGLGDNANRAIAETQSFTFIQNVINPFSKFIVDKFNIWIKQNYGNGFYISMEWETPNDPTADKDLFDMLLRNQVVTINEVREHFGYSSLKPKE